jgi:hypothetical protein
MNGERDNAIATALDIAIPVLRSGVTSARCLDVLRAAVSLAGPVRGVLELCQQVDELKRLLPRFPAARDGPVPVLVS